MDTKQASKERKEGKQKLQETGQERRGQKTEWIGSGTKVI